MVATAAPAKPEAPQAKPQAPQAARPAKLLIAPLRETGSFFALSLDILVQFAHPPFYWREFVEQCWFIARVATVPAVLQAITFNGLIVYYLDVLLVAVGAADLSGAGTAVAVVTQIGPVSTVLVLSGAGATAMCADLGARAIREEIDAMRVLGINPVHRLLAPRVAALVLIGNFINALVVITGLATCYAFSVYLLHITPGAYAASMTLLTSASSVVVSFLKASVFGVVGALVACYKGLTAGGGAQGIGNAVNETVVYTFVALLAANGVLSVIFASLTTVAV